MLGESLVPEEIYKAAALELQDVLAPSAVEISSNGIKIGDKFAKSFFVISYPKFLTAGWLAEVINMDALLDISIQIHPIATEQVLRKFRKKVAEVESQIRTRQEKGLVRDPMLDSAYQDLERLRDQLQQSEERMFSVGLYLTIYAESQEDLYKTEDAIRSTLESKLVYIKPALFQQEEAFTSTSPLGNDSMGIDLKMNSGPLSSFFPFISSDMTDNKGILYGINRHNSGLIIFDRFSLPNYNSVLFATSGAGKSYATKLEILRTMMFDTEIIIIDPEREYEYLAEAVGGRYFNIALSSEHHINPFDLPIPQKGEAPADLIRANIIQLVGLFRIILGGLTPEEDAIIDKAINETYALKDITPESNFAKIEPPLMSDFEMVLSSIEGSESLLQRLTKFTTGTWSGFLNKPSNVDINKKLVVFSIRDMEDELKPAAMYIITHYIWNAIRKNIRKRLLVVDEAWVMMQSDDAASFLFGIAKRGRKYFLGLATITQDVNDFINSKYGQAIVTNSSMQLLLKQAPSSIDKLQQVFNLTDEEKYLLLEANVGEGIFFAGTRHAAIKVIASHTENQIVTTDPHELEKIKKAKEAFAEASE
ncbi:conjugal transfer protein TraC [Candidatus Nomurabacteria bacterium]|nr:conjugal transfer protein TraC [Candidatus Nomurabacteria bacterium]